ncbi:MAG: flavodoxin domain-containing protein [Methanomassiliicoccaceae archaeon]|nr:flavodoxin domain-containing protein [Methanomassiliicoccaceae archaeon]
MTSKAVVYASSLGKTRKIAAYIAKGLGADLFDLKKQTVIDLSAYGHVIFGTGIHAGKPYRPLVDFMENNKDQLAGKKKSLFISCMFGEEKGEEQMRKVSASLGVADAIFFNGKKDKGEEGFGASVDAFIKEMSRR